MSEAQLQVPKAPIARAQRATVDRAAADATWRLAARDTDVTAYDELWYQGRPQRP